MNDNNGWKDIPGYEGLYQIIKYGLIKSLARDVYFRNGIRKQNDMILNDWLEQGYPRIRLSKKGKNKYFFVHILVGKIFVDNTENLPHLNHLDGITINPFYKNIEWCTPKQNVHHSINVLGRQGYNRKIVFDSNTGVFYDQAKEAIKSLGYKMWYTDFTKSIRTNNSYFKYC